MKKKIAVFVANIYKDMGRESVNGIMDAASKCNLKPIFFSTFADNFSSGSYERFRDYDAGDFVVFHLADLNRYAGLLCLGAILPVIFLKDIDTLLHKAPCPVVMLGAVREPFLSVMDDQAASMEAVVEHVISHHHCRDIVHIAGLKQMDFTWERIDIVRKTMEKHGLCLDDSRIYFGDLTPFCADAITEQMIRERTQRGEKPIPDAIVCANDHTAIGMSDALRARGYSVPGDAIVTGYDNVSRGEYSLPSITTSAQPFAEIGRQGIYVLNEKISGGQPNKVTLVPGKLILRQSCGCEPMGAVKYEALREKDRSVTSKMEKAVQSSTDMLLGASLDHSDEEIFEEIEKNCLQATGFRNAVLCLMRGWDRQIVIRNAEDMHSQRFDVVCGILNGQPVRRGPLPAGELLPEEMAEDSNAWFIYPIHHLNYFLGYMIVDPTLLDYSHIHMKSWLLSISTILENWRVRQQLFNTAEALEKLYQQDVLTGLYNRRGYMRFFKPYYMECRSAGTHLAVFLIDMNEMKHINDEYGHEEGDACLRVIADEMRNCARDEEICIRTGGDEFVVLAKHSSPQKAIDYAERLKSAIDRRIRKEEKPYVMSVSIGYAIGIPSEKEDQDIDQISEAFLREADKAMYREKRKYRERTGRTRKG